jgi:tRNA threonylcarbamoyladenosine biosynthesis protein TsaB
MNILAIDTTGEGSSVAFVSFDECIGYQSHHSRHSDCLLPLLNELFSKTGYNYSNIDAYAVTTGPGSFTGIRVGIAAVLGMRLVTKKRVLGITNFEAHSFYVSLANKDNRPISVIIKAHRDQLCGQIFDHKLNSIHGPVLCSETALSSFMPGNCLVGGNCTDCARDFAVVHPDKPLAVFTGMMAYHKIKLGVAAKPEPLYFMKFANLNGE